MGNYRIIEKLSKQKRNITTFIHASASSCISSNDLPTNLLLWDTIYGYHSINEPNTSFTLSFFTPFYIEKIMLRSALNRDPRYWIIEGSKNGIDYVQLYKNEGEPLCDKWVPFDDSSTIGCMDHLSKTFDAEAPGKYTSVRFRMYSVSSNNDYFLVLDSIDFIGNVRIPINTCKTRKMNSINVFIVVLLMTY